MILKGLPFPEACVLAYRSMELTLTSVLTQLSH